jgi:tetratricopeptide (TPR) repeat protein
MVSLALVLALSVPAADPLVPVALVAEVKAPVSVGRGKKKVAFSESDYLLPGDRVEVGKGGSLKLLLLGDGTRLRVKEGQAVVGEKGCDPAASAEVLEGPRPDPELLRYLREAYRERTAGRAAGSVLRGGGAVPAEVERARGVAPLFGAWVLTDHPTLTWPGLPQAKGYRVTLLSGAEGRDEKVLWRATTDKTVLPYPEEEKVLPPGLKYRWRVAAQLDGGEKEVAESMFFVATPREMDRLRRLRRMAESEDPADRLLAADAYDAAGVYDKALPLYEKLAEKFETAAGYQLALAAYYDRAGQKDKAEAARKRAKVLGAKVEED